MPLDTEALAKGCGGRLETATQLCRAEIGRLEAAFASGAPVTIGCTQEEGAFADAADAAGDVAPYALANVRETGGWSSDAAAAGPKMAALLAMASVPVSDAALVTLESEGVALVLGRDEVAIEAARRLADHLDVTVLLDRPVAIVPPRKADFPVLKGRVRNASGHLGAFELTIDDYAAPSPASRARLDFGPARDGATSACDVVIDLTGGTPLFPAHDLRPGYLRADPRDPVAVERVLFEAANLVGTFDKPRYVNFDAGLCAHSRSKIVGCTRCLDLCPTGAISPAGDHVAIDPAVCAGCGQCAAACPTGAASYALPAVGDLVARLRVMMRAFREAGGRDAVVLFHDAEHGEPLVDALARFGDGLPASVIPVAVNEIGQVGPETLAALFAYGAAGALFLAREKPKHPLDGLARTVETVNTILTALGFGENPVAVIETDDPDALGAAAHAAARAREGAGAAVPAAFLAQPKKRQLLEIAFRELHRVAPTPVPVVPLAAGAPFGGIVVDVEGCTLCLSCVSACPADALSDNSERPMLRFTESLCVQCGLCAATCPEGVITLEPRLDFAAWDAPRRVIKEEEPFCCVECGKAFGTRSTIERVMEKLGGRHWMFAGADGERRLRVLQMCEDCRVQAVVNESFDPHATERPRPRTSEDYIRERGKLS
ncbi:4Fe-4S binding protein [Salinarimonas chemoclinalis]|uniref:4Fe-4S binding protein n=1 Tax=Salinarimonas chemoclinalis TaxID=3241599 RepID=UPI0035587B53